MDNDNINSAKIDPSIANNSLLQSALHYLELGLSLIPIPFGTKAPIQKEWQKLRLKEGDIPIHFGGTGNIGILLGDASQGLTDVDLDCPEAITIADLFLPLTGEFGRLSKPRSHRLFFSNVKQTIRFQDTEKNKDAATGKEKQTTLVELRSNGGQTLFPPSQNPSGEPVRFSVPQNEIVRMDEVELERRVTLLAVSSLFARHWVGEGSRQEAALSLSGGLLRRGLSEEETTLIIRGIVIATKDEELSSRIQAVASSAKALIERRPVTGFRTLTPLLSGDGKKVIDRICEWLRLEQKYSSYTTNSDWLPRKPLPPMEPEAPSLSEELIPFPLRPWLADIADRMQVPLEYPTIALLVGVGTVIGRQCGIRPKRKDDWVVVPNFWGAIVGRPGVLKTPAIIQALKPLSWLAAKERKKYESVMNEAISLNNYIVAQMEGVKSQIKQKAKGGDYAVNDLKEKLAQLQREAEECKKKEKRYVTSDSTPEKIADLLIENPNGLLLLRDELYGFLRLLEKPGYENARTFFLEAWSGLVENHRIDRMLRGSTLVPALRLALFGSIQPGRLRDFFADAMKGGSGDDGMMQRLQLLVYPPIPPDWKLVDRFPNSVEKERVYGIFEKLVGLQPTAIGATVDKYDSVPFLRFSEEAQCLFNEWLTNLEKRLRSAEIASAAFESHLGKYRSLLPALALSFHLIDWATSGVPTEIGLESARLAAKWCDFLERHAAKVYAGAMNPEITAAHELARKIREKKIKDGMSVRDIYRRNWSQLDTHAKVEAGLCVLADSNWIRIEEFRGPSGAPSEKIRLHPELIEEQSNGEV